MYFPSPALLDKYGTHIIPIEKINLSDWEITAQINYPFFKIDILHYFRLIDYFFKNVKNEYFDESDTIYDFKQLISGMDHLHSNNTMLNVLNIFNIECINKTRAKIPTFIFHYNIINNHLSFESFDSISLDFLMQENPFYNYLNKEIYFSIFYQYLAAYRVLLDINPNSVLDVVNFFVQDLGNQHILTFPIGDGNIKIKTRYLLRCRVSYGFDKTKQPFHPFTILSSLINTICFNFYFKNEILSLLGLKQIIDGITIDLPFDIDPIDLLHLCLTKFDIKVQFNNILTLDNRKLEFNNFTDNFTKDYFYPIYDISLYPDLPKTPPYIIEKGKQPIFKI